MKILDKAINYLKEAVRVDTMEYEHAHGKKPSGKGHWAFSFGTGIKKVDDLFWVRGKNYNEAISIAKKEAKKRGSSVVKVMS